MTKKIEFISPTQEVWDKLPTPQPAKKYIADWYKNSDNFIGGKKEYGENGLNKDIRLCAPFLDIMLNGYILELSCDVVVEKDINGRTFAWTQNPPPIIPRNPEMAKTLPRPAGHDNEMYAWNMSHGILTPPGYSSIITHPFNRFDLPFTTTSGVIESDQYSMPGEIPF